MGEEVHMSEYRDACSSDDGDEDRVTEWEIGLPNADDLTPLSQALIPPELASAFSISPEPYRTVVDVNRASRCTVSGLRGGNWKGVLVNEFKSFNDNETRDGDPMVIQGDETDRDGDGDGSGSGSGSDSRKLRKIDCAEEADSALRIEDSADDQSARNSKRPRLVWTPQLHKRFVDVVAHLGIKNAVPKTIMQLMNVEGLTRENVASHLQKYRLYLKRMQGLSNEGPLSSDQLFASTPVPQSLNDSSGSVQASRHDVHGNGNTPVPIPMPYPSPMMPVPFYGVAIGHGQMGMPVGNSGGGYHGFDAHSYNMMQQRDWSGNKYGSMGQYPPHVTPNDK